MTLIFVVVTFTAEHNMSLLFKKNPANLVGIVNYSVNVCTVKFKDDQFLDLTSHFTLDTITIQVYICLINSCWLAYIGWGEANIVVFSFFLVIL